MQKLHTTLIVLLLVFTSCSKEALEQPALAETPTQAETPAEENLFSSKKGQKIQLNLPGEEDKLSTFVFDGNNWVGQGTTPGSKGFYVKITDLPGGGMNARALDFLETNPPAGGNPFWARGVSHTYSSKPESLELVIRSLAVFYQHVDIKGGVWRINREDGTTKDRFQLRSPNYLANVAINFNPWDTYTKSFLSSSYLGIDIDFSTRYGKIVASFSKHTIVASGAGPSAGDAIDRVVLPGQIVPTFRK